MIQELFGGGNHTSAGGGLITNVGEKDSSPHFTGVVHAPAISQSPSPKSSTISTTNPKTSSENLTPLRCPRCDSSNTKFCYYNNYNLTQPRHFCKTCRRYWTKGGALRNVPIGGGCRKNNKINSNIGHAIVPSPLGKPKFIRSHLLTSSDQNNMGKILSSNFPNQLDQGLSANSLLWTSSPQTSHLLALLRSNQTQNPHPNFNYAMMMNYVKQEESSEGLRMDPSYNSNNFWRNNHEESHQLAELHQQSGTGLMVQNVSNQDYYNQRVGLKSADHEHYNNYSDTHNYVPAGLIMGNVHASTSPANCSEILESAPVNIVGGGQVVSCWNNNNNI